MFAHLNVCSADNKSVSLSGRFKDTVDVQVISKTYVDNTFVLGNFLTNSFSQPNRIDHDLHEGCSLSFIRNDVPSTFPVTVKKLVQGLYVELNLRNDRFWLISSS